MRAHWVLSNHLIRWPWLESNKDFDWIWIPASPLSLSLISSNVNKNRAFFPENMVPLYMGWWEYRGRPWSQIGLLQCICLNRQQVLKAHKTYAFRDGHPHVHRGLWPTILYVNNVRQEKENFEIGSKIQR